jgi:hypothetical protein
MDDQNREERPTRGRVVPILWRGLVIVVLASILVLWGWLTVTGHGTEATAAITALALGSIIVRWFFRK